ncbi:MAG: DNA polymerase I [Dehalococcoidia bacterium]|nr:DNA polymerase I [Dehalococcoidia bacterium]
MLAEGSTQNKRRHLLLLLDGTALMHRSFYALPPLTVSITGEPINAVYGFANTLLKLLVDFNPAYWAVAFDRPTPTFRHEKFKEYKAQRRKTPEELKLQINRVRQLVNTFHIPIFEMDGFEADDVLGTLSKQSNEQDIETIIVTGDNDILQLITAGIKTLMPRRTFKDTVLYDEQAVKQKYGIKPSQVIDLKALAGDTSDNIPGVPGIGEKTATKLIQQYSSIEGIYAHIEQLSPGKVQTTLRQYESRVFQNKELVTIVRDVPVNLNLENCKVSAYDRSEVVSLFRELEFIKLLPRLPRESYHLTSSSSQENTFQIINTEPALDKILNQIETTNEIVISFETTLTPSLFAQEKKPKSTKLTTELLGIAISPTPGKASYIPLGHHGLGQPEQLSPNTVIAKLKPILESSKVKKIAYNGKHIMGVLANYEVELKNLTFDIMIAAHLLGENNLSLKVIAFNKLGIEIPLLGDLIGTGKKQIPLATVETKKFASYVCANLATIWNLKREFDNQLHQQGLYHLFCSEELPLIPVLLAMERNGISLDTKLLSELSFKLGKKMLQIETQIYDSLGYKFNINSSQQLANVLFEQLKLPRSRKTKSGYSTQASVLQGLKGFHPIVELVLQYRQLSKLKSTYVDALPALVNHETGRIHTNFNQTGTSTGRLSSSEPNLQNIPVRETLGNMIRQAIIAPHGSYFLSADYSQIDLRALAHLSQDITLITAFAHNEDIHATTAGKIFDIPPDKITPEMRRVAKTVNFGVIYGMSNYGLEQATEFNREEAAEFIALYFEKYPDVKKYIEKTKEQAKKLGYVQTITGRRRYIPGINSTNRQIREAAERMAINAPVQGTSADIIKIAMINVHNEIKKRNLRSKMLLQIHDELLFEVPQDKIEEIKSLVTEIMPKAIKLCVPLKIDIKVGKNWGEMA